MSIELRASIDIAVRPLRGWQVLTGYPFILRADTSAAPNGPG